ncbi:MAG TPA: family 10 glycosylhydrolase [Prolixibacteraceae bacterium]|nr:family 10 glycosylhydrolase [Prolixibacteraceae bacterium]
MIKLSFIKAVLLAAMIMGFATGQASGQLLHPKFEFRGVWVATVNNIDWPSQPGLPVETQKKEVISMLNLHKSLGMNAIVLQVRPCSDTFYPSPLEPWSRYLTGIPGKPPEPFWDPLRFWIDECHLRGMELHAWLNPYRIAQHANEPLAYDHKIFSKPEWAIIYGDKIYFDPGIPGTRDYVTSVVCDIVRRYDVDGIHMDDYFYPYPTKDPFPDEGSFKRFSRAFPAEEKEAWRRENVDILIKMISDSIRAINPHVKFGISPFGVWRNLTDDPSGSATKAGITNYDHLYADIRKWLKEGWIDYVVPQIYWEIGHKLADFKTLCEWWNANSFGRNLYIGLAPYKIDSKATVDAWRKKDQLPDQLELLRKYPNISGCVFFSSRSFTKNLLGFQDSLKNRLFKHASLTPPLASSQTNLPDPPTNVSVSGRKVRWEGPIAGSTGARPYSYLIYLNQPNELFDPGNSLKIVGYTLEPQAELQKKRERKKKNWSLRVTTLDRDHRESLPSTPASIRY